jgi:enolase
MAIERIIVREIFDSRGEPTIEVAVTESGVTSSAAVPSGKSRGMREAVVLSASDAQAAAAGPLQREIIGHSFDSIQALDRKLIALDGTKNKSVLGGNLMLGVSVAHARNLATTHAKPLWRIIHNEFFSDQPTASTPPLIFANLVNGGAHARNTLAFQEYLVIARTTVSVTQTVRDVVRIYHTLGDALRERFHIKAIPLGDEEGYSLDFKSNMEPLTLMTECIARCGLADRFSLGLDVAASSFYANGRYTFEKTTRTTAELVETYGRFFGSVPALVSIEDPFDENDAQGFKELYERFPQKLIVGDDLTVTDPLRIEEFARGKCISGVIVKPNQIGTLTESCMALRAAHDAGVKTIVSHRSGETEDTLIIHLARASGAEGVKIGAPLNERIVKFDELIRLYE